MFVRRTVLGLTENQSVGQSYTEGLSVTAVGWLKCDLAAIKLAPENLP